MSVYRLTKEGYPSREIIASEQFVLDNFSDWSYELLRAEPAPTHQTEFSPKELYDSFTTDEALLALKSTNADVRAQAQLLTVNRGVTVSASDAGYQSAIDLLETEGVLTADRAADYRNGIPLGV